MPEDNKYLEHFIKMRRSRKKMCPRVEAQIVQHSGKTDSGSNISTFSFRCPVIHIILKNTGPKLPALICVVNGVLQAFEVNRS